MTPIMQLYSSVIVHYMVVTYLRGHEDLVFLSMSK